MNDDIRAYARLGLVHHMLYPECAESSEVHVETLERFCRRPDIETFDCCTPYGEAWRERIIPVLRACGKEHLAFAIHFYPLRLLPLAARTPIARAQRDLIMDDLIGQAAAMGATGFVFGPGVPSWHDAGPEDFAAFDDFCGQLCDKLAPHGITALLEPFDTDVDKKFLYGPIADCVKLAERLCARHDNFGFELDMAHLPLMREDFADAIRRTAPWLKRVHLGNCVFRDRSDPRWGDTHPPIGYPGGEIDVPELTTILRALLEHGFLSKENRGDLLIEMTRFPGKGVDETVEDGFARLAEAWRRV